MSVNIFARGDYVQPRAVPFGYDARYFAVELGNIARAMPPSTVRLFKATASAFVDIPRATDSIILYDSTAHAITVNLPQPNQAQRLVLTCKRINGGANLVTLVGTIDGVAGRTLNAQYKSVTIVSDGNTYYLLSAI
jgi:hypothetical protein